MDIQNKEDKVWVTLEKTINLGNYESVKVIVGQSRTIQPKDDPEKLLTDVCEETFDVLQTKSREYKKLLTPKRRFKED